MQFNFEWRDLRSDRVNDVIWHEHLPNTTIYFD